MLNTDAYSAPAVYDQNTILCDHDFDIANTLTQAEIQAIFDARNSFLKITLIPQQVNRQVG